MEEIRKYFKYDPITGYITHNGRIKGTIGTHGYIRIKYKEKPYQAHRLAWLLYYGEWPKEDLDHINGNKLDNRIFNLEEVSNLENIRRYNNRRNKF